MPNNDAPPPPHPKNSGPGLRRGPRPLLMHLALAAQKQMSQPSGVTWPSSSADWQRLIAQPSAQPGAQPGAGPDAALLAGIAAYRRHPWTRDVTNPPAIWQEGETRLLDYGGTGMAPPLLIVPSLVNRATILDLSQDRSMARSLAAAGLRVLLLDWGWPGPEERKTGLDALITGRLARAIAAAQRPVSLVGYCMGGLLALAAAQLQPKQVAGLALLATPWDFHATGTMRDIARLLEALEPVMQATGTLPIDALQMLFAHGDPHGVGDKYRAFGQTDQTTLRARQFVAVEDWLNDGVPLAAPVARTCLADWYGRNAPSTGTWQVGSTAIDPRQITVPCFVAIPGRDRIVPPESALPLAALLPKPVVVRPTAGHVGMVAGATAETALWQPLAAWALGIGEKTTAFRGRKRKASLPA